MKKQPEVTEKTRQAFIDAFCKLYTEKPIEKISVQEVTKIAGYNRSTFYQYFCDIYELLSYIENDVIDYIRRKMPQNSSKSKILERSTQDAVTLLKEKDAYLNALLGEFGNNRFIERLKAEFINQLDNFGFPSSNPLTPYYIEFHLSITISLYRFWHFRGKDLSPDELVGLINRLSTKGLSFH